MNVVISFSGRRDGNCDQIARYLSSDCDNIIYFRDLRVHECVNCEYQCFGGQCIYRDDDLYALYSSLTDFDRIYLVVPIYCANPPSIYFKFAERAQDYFSDNCSKYEEFIKKLYVIAVCGFVEDDKDFLRIFNRYFDYTPYKNRVLAIERHRYGLKLKESVLMIEEVKKKLDAFLKMQIEINYSDYDLRRPCEEDLVEIQNFKDEFISKDEKIIGGGPLAKLTPKEWLDYNKEMELTNDVNLCKTLQMGLFHRKTGVLIGLIQLRPQLKGYFEDFAGNIGYCIRPSERNKGFAKHMLKEILEICKALKMEKVLLTCFEDNDYSQKVIESNGGIYEKTVFDNQKYNKSLKRYWIYI